MALIIKLIAGIVLGMLCGLYAPHWLTQLLLTFKALFGQLLFFIIPLLILFFITSGIAALPRNSGKLLGRTLGIAYLSTIVAGVLAFVIASIVVPMLTTASAATAARTPAGGCAERATAATLETAPVEAPVVEATTPVEVIAAPEVEVAPVREGIELVQTKLKSILSQKGLKEIESLNTPFDTDLHEAITQIPAPSKKEVGKVIDEVEKGYSLNGKVIRYTKVVVGQ